MARVEASAVSDDPLSLTPDRPDDRHAFEQRDADEIGAHIEGSLPLELAWSIIPTLIAMVMFVWGAKLYYEMRRPPAESLQVYAVGKQWMWKFQHQGGQREINELHVPVGRPVKVLVTSEDVLHDLYFPSFRTKIDAIPGRYMPMWFTATKPGRYHIFCAEYCGTKHSGMIGTVIVMEPTQYQEWLAGGATEGTMAERGSKLFNDLACNTCHLDNGQGRGPSLKDLVGKAVEMTDGSTAVVDEGYLRESILNSQARVVKGFQPLMPTFQGLVSEEGLAALIEHIKSLSPQSASAAPALVPAAAATGATPAAPAQGAGR